MKIGFWKSRVALAAALAVAPGALSAQGSTFNACYVPNVGAIYLIRIAGLPPNCLSTSHIEISWTDGSPNVPDGSIVTVKLADGAVTTVKLADLAVTAAKLAAGAVGTAQLADGAVTSAKLAADVPIGVTNHAQLSGLASDDHLQYVLTNGGRGLTGSLNAGGNRISGLGAATAAGDAVRFEQAVKPGDGAGGDLAGSFPSPTVAALRGRPVSATAPVSGQVLGWSGDAWQPVTPASGVTQHSQLTGLAGDDHLQYVLANGGRPLAGNLNAGGNRVVGLAAATGAGDAVRFEQAVKGGDAAGGDLTGSYPNPGVAALRGSVVSATAPTANQVLTWSGTSWEPRTPTTGVSDHGALSGLSDDDHPQYLLADGVRSSTNGFAVTGTLNSGNMPMSGAGVRLMWHPRKAAFMAGESEFGDSEDIIGLHSTAIGLNVTAAGVASVAIGQGGTASGSYATVAGFESVASGTGSVAIGLGANASARASTAMGEVTRASGQSSTAVGQGTTASGASSTAFGQVTTASGFAATAMGWGTTASGGQATAMGDFTSATGSSATAMGGGTTASGAWATAMGRITTAQAYASVVIGRWNLVEGNPVSWIPSDPLFVAGNGSDESARSNALTLFKNGNLTIAGTLTESSDIRLKERVQSLEDVLTRILQLDPIRYRFRDGTGHPPEIKIGLSAQAVEPLFPELVRRDADGYLSLAYADLSAVLVRAIQEQQKEIAALRTELVEIRGRLTGEGREGRQ